MLTCTDRYWDAEGHRGSPKGSLSLHHCVRESYQNRITFLCTSREKLNLLMAVKQVSLWQSSDVLDEPNSQSTGYKIHSELRDSQVGSGQEQ